MRLQNVLSLAVALVVLAQAHPAAAQVGPADALCPRAVPKLAAFNEAKASNDMAKIAAAVRAIADAYELCASEAQVTKGVAVEPTVNYDKTRAAQYLVVEGRALAAGGNTADAIAALKKARHLADDVAIWQPESQAWHASPTGGGPAPGAGSAALGAPSQASAGGGNEAHRNTDLGGSRYKDAATEIRAAADAELKKLEPPAAH
jgi:hypothetical protein